MWNDFKNFYIALYILLRRIIRLFVDIVTGIYKFIIPVENSLKGTVNPEECYRILILAISTGGGFETFIDYLEKHLQDFIVDPVLSVGIKAFCEHAHQKHLPIAFFIIIFLLDYLRRKNHGTD